MSNFNYKNVDVAAVMVFYKPDASAYENLKKISIQMDLVILIWNSLYEENYLNLDNVIHIKNEENLGLGKALNQGVSLALSKGYSLFCTFDQDTIIFENFREKMIFTLKKLSQKHKIGLISPAYSNQSSHKKNPNLNEKFKLLSTAVQSGSLYTKECIQTCGKFREDFFIESIDTEYCLRLKSYGFTIGQCTTPIMYHGAGEKGIKFFFGREVTITNHSAERLFLQYRNYAYTLKCYWLKNPKWAINSSFSMLKKYLLICIFEKNKTKKGKAITKGIYIGFFKNFISKS